jgi:ankyrin repeat protein
MDVDRKPMKKKISLWLSPVFLASLLFAAPLAQAADPQLDRALFEASMHRVPERVGELLQKGADPNFEDAFGVTPLINAALRGNLRTAVLLLDAGARVDEDGRNGCTSLTWAARNGQISMINLLLDRGADINHRDLGRLTPVIRASWNGQQAAVALLIERGADVSAEDDFGNTALTYALANEYLEIVALLREAGVVRKADTVQGAKNRVERQPFVPCTRSAFEG